MKQFGLIGFPLEHSFSKSYFTKKFERENIRDCSFENFPLEDLSAFPDLLRNHPGLCGLAVTIPFKEKILALADTATDEVVEIGAANCIRIQSGICTAYNTDIIGFRQSLDRFLGNNPLPALVLGTGGAAKAIAFVLRKLDVRYLQVSRQQQIGTITYAAISPDLLNSYPLIINCTPLGMFPHTESAPPIPYRWLTPANRLFDLVYNPEKTRFMEYGEAAGCSVCNGLDMLEIQAEANWHIWNAL